MSNVVSITSKTCFSALIEMIKIFPFKRPLAAEQAYSTESLATIELYSELNLSIVLPVF
jgi:hypothetical protein